jgi:N4-gp56 family major capsid protein
MATTTLGNLQPAVQQHFNRVLLSVKQPYLIYTLPAMEDMLPQHSGNIQRRRRYNTINPSTTPLGPSGLAPQPVNIPVTDIDATLEFYGQYARITEQVLLVNEDAVLNQYTLRLGQSMRESQDQLARNALLAGASTYQMQNGINGDAPTNMTPQDWYNVSRILLGNSAKTVMTSIEGMNKIGTGPVRNSYMALGHTDISVDLENLAGFRRAAEYPEQSKVLPSEYGTFSYLRYFLAADPLGAIQPNSSAVFQQNVYPVSCVGQEALSITSLEGYNAQFVYRDPLVASTLGLYAEVGYKFADAPRVLYDQWCVNAFMTLQFPPMQ